MDIDISGVQTHTHTHTHKHTHTHTEMYTVELNNLLVYINAAMTGI